VDVIFSQGRLPGVVLIEIERREDSRGHFARTMCREEFANHGLAFDFAQDSYSYNRARGTVRGLHYQRPPFAEIKLVRCVRGAIFDVIVDVRPSSATWLAWESFVLSAENGRAIYIPEGFAHGFQTLEDETDVSYRISRPYTPEAAAGLRYDDPAVGVCWPEPVTAISSRDASWPYLSPPSRRVLRSLDTSTDCHLRAS
jgi:dTDP-4-dehydrorhamnose 3,5-epimerase